MNLKTPLITAALIIASACGKGGGGGGSSSANPSCVEKLDLFTENAQHEPATTEGAVNEVIIGDLQWQSTNALKDAMKRSNAASTVYLSIPAQYSRCTGFLINDNMIMTNNHCVSNASEARGVTATFGYTDTDKGQQYSCGEFVATNRALDMGIIRCKGNPGKNHPKVVLADYPGEVKEKIYITHQNCNYRSNPSCKPTQKHSAGSILGSNNSNLEHNADTLPGSSGSPIFDEASHKVVAIHNAGQNYGPNNGGMNYGIPMFKIVDYLRRNHPEVSLTASADRKPAYLSCK